MKELKDLLRYEPETGRFFWLTTTRTMKAGTEAGYRNPKTGYWIIRLGGKNYRRARLAWLYTTGRWPADQIDHINGNKIDDRIGNLREANTSQNHGNLSLSRANTTGFKGVSWHKRIRRWQASIRVRGRLRFLGSFSTAEEAAAAYEQAARVEFGEFARIK